MDKFETQSGGHLKEGHEESDLTPREVVQVAIFLVGDLAVHDALIHPQHIDGAQNNP